MRKLLFLSLFVVCVCLAFMVGCGNNNGKGKVAFTLRNSGTPATPNIVVPDSCTKVEMRLFQTEDIATAESGEDDTESSDSSEDNSESDSDSDSKDDTSDEGTDAENASTEEESSSSELYVSTTYSAGDEVSLELEDVPVGTWVLLVNALDASGNVLGHVQMPVKISSGKKVKVEEWLLPGTAPSGYVFVAHPTAGALTRICLESETVVSQPLKGYTPACLFAPNGISGKVDDKLYCTTGANSILELTPSLVDATCEVEQCGFVAEAEQAMGGVLGTISFYLEGGVRFFHYDTHKYSNLVTTGAKAGAISNVVNGYSYVANAGPKTLSKIDVSGERVSGTNVYLGYIADALAQNDAGTRIWTCGGALNSEAPYIRVIEPDGTLVRHYTTKLGGPGAVVVNDDVACISDVSRKEIIFMSDDGGSTSEELERVDIGAGGDSMVCDGERLYVLCSSVGKVAVVDLETMALIKTISVGSGGMSLLWVAR